MQISDKMVRAAMSVPRSGFANADLWWRAALEAALSAMWQDISTAPKDGTPIQCLRHGTQFIARWLDGGWSLDLGGDDEGLVLKPIHNPTHWHHLLPPKIEIEG